MHGEPKYGPDFTAFAYADPRAVPGGTLRLSATGTFDTLNPFAVRGRVAGGWQLVFETLMTRALDEPFTLYGLVAATIDTPSDRSWVEFRLRPEARWHDGTPITAADVLFSWRTLRDHGRPNHRSYYRKVTEGQAPDPQRVRFIFAPDPGGPDRELPLILGLMPLLSEKFWSGRRFGETILTPPLGSGPYQVAAVDPGRAITYRRRPDYWGRHLAVNRHLGNFEVMRTDYFRDEMVALEAFRAGAVDFRRETDPRRWATAYGDESGNGRGMRRERVAHGRPEAARGLVFNLRRAPFDRPLVRAALAYALDFAWINRVLFHGAYRRTESYYPNSELAARGVPEGRERALLDPFRAVLPPALFTRPFALPTTDGRDPAGRRGNLRQAAALLRDAGFTIHDGRCIDPAGRPFRFEIVLVDPSDERVALSFADNLARLGIEARVRTVDSAQYQARMTAFDFDMTIQWWLSTLSPGNEQLFYFSSAAAGDPGSRNYPGIASPVVDALAGGLAQAADRADLVARVRALDRVLLWGDYMIPLYHLGAELIAYHGHLRRPAVTPLYGVTLDAWWHDPEPPP